MPELLGFSHIAFTVSEPAESKRWYEQALGCTALIDTEDFVMMAHLGSNMIIGLKRHPDQPDGEFTHLNIGLDHFSFGVASEAELEKWRGHFDEVGIKHSGIETSMFGKHLNFRDPDQIPLELLYTDFSAANG